MYPVCPSIASTERILPAPTFEIFGPSSMGCLLGTGDVGLNVSNSSQTLCAGDRDRKGSKDVVYFKVATRL